MVLVRRPSNEVDQWLPLREMLCRVVAHAAGQVAEAQAAIDMLVEDEGIILLPATG
jgi:hypothetical protein